MDAATVKSFLAPSDRMDDLWRHIADHIELIAVASRQKLTAEDIREMLEKGHQQCWLVSDGKELFCVVLTEVVQYPQKKICRIIGVVGKDKKKWLHLREDIHEWAREQGCVGMEAIARSGWARYLEDYKKTHVVLERDL